MKEGQELSTPRVIDSQHSEPYAQNPYIVGKPHVAARLVVDVFMKGARNMNFLAFRARAAIENDS